MKTVDLDSMIQINLTEDGKKTLVDFFYGDSPRHLFESDDDYENGYLTLTLSEFFEFFGPSISEDHSVYNDLFVDGKIEFI